MKLPARTHQILALVAMLTLGGCQWSDCPEAKGNITEEQLALAAVERITVEGDIAVIWQAGAAQEVMVKGPSDLLPKLQRKVENGHWTIGVEGCHRSRTPIEVRLTTPSLSMVRLQGSGEVRGTSTLESDALTVELQGSGDIMLDVSVRTLNGALEGSGDLQLSGTAEHFNARMTGSGDLRAAGLDARDVNASLTGSGDIQVTCSGVLDAAITGSGDITYGGSPTEVRDRISGSGTLSARP